MRKFMARIRGAVAVSENTSTASSAKSSAFAMKATPITVRRS